MVTLLVSFVHRANSLVLAADKCNPPDAVEADSNNTPSAMAALEVENALLKA
jgi:hypothetical protein